MDLITVQRVVVASQRADLDLGTPLGGGTWLYSEPQDATVLVDLLGFGWEPVTRTETHLSIAATCPVAVLRELPDSPLFAPGADALLASWKVQRMATVGGNIALSLPAGPMTALAVGLGATLTLWTATGERVVEALDFVTGVRTNVLRPGEVIRSIDFPLAHLTQPAALRRIALSPLGRTGTLVTARRDGERILLGVTGGTARPHLLGALAELDDIDDWYDDAHGSPDWRAAMTWRFATELVEELS